ncbi:aspartyl/glutamyl-tRNA(Asn/Gln) amidotransferase subunit A [Thermaerobacter marianensis DSM 12885]|uniref:Glutamyl-tRNA(Gln) amidotransferase subunit A n=1 Tax=Thermaerobacter marianensis (strain ATCC 700841 / DSM 12885 / JCM 10246 / 7p75a) TaxID=644966 RepID=E6SMG5_THEM7|nr:Asp-tRNA(Asn)/Glu-tRNA(Gln) amidotransferase subunit GatA [Thermaerobacter marianensis]ADU50425.1 aspartyl/glutamyl-tRNA(Asn/Gln) amidotransferase subunit A [Thermaerobacter marianensis DSM 12885]
MEELWFEPAHRLARRLEAGEISARELARAFLDRIQELDGTVGAYLTVTAELALAQAREEDDKRRRGEPVGPLSGIPVAIKDNLCIQGVPTTAASKLLAGYRPPYTATAVERLRKAGAVVLGKTNMDEFAMGSSTENSAFRITRNPWDPQRVPGGSSGGSAAAVAAGEAAAALGSDTGGSIRQPAAFCGVVGLKPTYGRVSRYGLIAFASSLDQIGPLTRDVTDAALLMEAIAGHDPADATSAPVPVPSWRDALTGEVAGVRIGLPREFYGEAVEPEVAGAVRAAVERLVADGAVADETSLPSAEHALPAYYLIATAEASSNLARYDGVRYGYRADAGNLADMYLETRKNFGPEVKRRILLGTFALREGYYDAYYRKALQVRRLIKDDFDRLFATFDVLITPTSPVVAFPLGARTADPLAMYAADICTLPVNLAGLPAVSVPCGFAGGLPVGLQIIGRPFAEDMVLRVAYAIEQRLQLDLRPPLGRVAA